MNYREFNKLVLEYYSLRSKSSFCTLSIDSKEMESIAPISELTTFYPLRRSWEDLLKLHQGIPQYFGLIAIQCLAASLMQNDENNSSDAYQVRLRELIGLTDNNSLQALFKGNSVETPTQEIIWYSAKAYLYNHLKLNLDIPKRTKNAWRYVRYPISQALLNTEDLKYFTVFFDQEFLVGEDIPFNYFEKRLIASLSRLRLTRRAMELLFDSQKQEKCIRQVYDFFYSWNGVVVDFLVNKKLHTNTTNLNENFQQTLLLRMEKNLPEFYLISKSSNYEKVKTQELFCLDNYIYFHSDLIIFNEIDYYPNEYESSRFIHSENYCYILIKNDKRTREYNYLYYNSFKKHEVDKNVWLFQYKSDDKPSCLSKLIQNINPIRLSGGIKVNRKREYLKGYGPTINGFSNYTVIFEHKQCSYDTKEALCGTYNVRVDNFRDIEFKIMDTQELTETIKPKNKGWHLSKYTISDKYDLEGSLIFSSGIERENIIRSWIKINSRSRDNKYNSSNYLIKAINNSIL